jgi:hypothetical protein
MCFAGSLERTSCCHSLMGRPYFFSMDGKYEAGPLIDSADTMFQAPGESAVGRLLTESVKRNGILQGAMRKTFMAAVLNDHHLDASAFCSRYPLARASSSAILSPRGGVDACTRVGGGPAAA